MIPGTNPTRLGYGPDIGGGNDRSHEYELRRKSFHGNTFQPPARQARLFAAVVASSIRNADGNVIDITGDCERTSRTRAPLACRRLHVFRTMAVENRRTATASRRLHRPLRRSRAVTPRRCRRCVGRRDLQRLGNGSLCDALWCSTVDRCEPRPVAPAHGPSFTRRCGTLDGQLRRRTWSRPMVRVERQGVHATSWSATSGNRSELAPRVAEGAFRSRSHAGLL